MSYIILVRNPGRGGLLTIQNEDDEIMDFDTEEAAEELASEHRLCQAWGYQIVDVEV